MSLSVLRGRDVLSDRKCKIRRVVLVLVLVIVLGEFHTEHVDENDLRKGVP